MDILRFNRRENDSLIFSNDAGDDFSLAADELLLTEVRNAVRASTGAQKVNPRILQSLIRAGKSREEIIAETGAELFDIERYEGPVIAEREFMLNRAHQVRVKTSANEHTEQQFGSVIAERLISLGAVNVEWQSWRDNEAGWMVTLEFIENSTARRAVWSFDHKKFILTPITPDAVNLSRLADPGDTLIPKLRAVDDLVANERFDSGAFSRGTIDHIDEVSDVDIETSPSDVHGQTADISQPMSPAKEAALRSGHPSTGSIPIIPNADEFARRREIEERAISTSHEAPQDLGETADLLDALRRRRNERDHTSPSGEHKFDTVAPPAPIQLHAESPHHSDAEFSEIIDPMVPSDANDHSVNGQSSQEEPAKKPKGRTSIPSWDDILFGTRGDNDNT